MREKTSGVSPVVGVMMMLVVTIIIAAVVSGFAGGLIGDSEQKTPTLSMDVKIANTGSASDSGFTATVLSISEPTSTKQLKMTTSWVTTMKDKSTYLSGKLSSIADGATFVGGNTSALGTGAPYGFGPGVTGDVAMESPYNTVQHFGNYTLMQGTGMIAEPAENYSNYKYISGSAAEKVLGTGWEQLRAGDIVTVRVIYMPTGKLMFQKEVAVTGV
jgi:FlaG/FlaF family flagellin (archaellin)